jgi:hypothetical protein
MKETRFPSAPSLPSSVLLALHLQQHPQPRLHQQPHLLPLLRHRSLRQHQWLRLRHNQLRHRSPLQ